MKQSFSSVSNEIILALAAHVLRYKLWNSENLFVSQSKNTDEKEKEKKKIQKATHYFLRYSQTTK